LTDSKQTGTFTVKNTDYISDGAVNVIYGNLNRNKTVTLRLLTTFSSLLRIMDWHMRAVASYNYYNNTTGVCRILDGDGNCLALKNNKYAYMIITNITCYNKVGDTGRIVADVEFQTVRYR
jgi:hypothetical protein